MFMVSSMMRASVHPYSQHRAGGGRVRGTKQDEGRTFEDEGKRKSPTDVD